MIQVVIIGSGNMAQAIISCCLKANFNVLGIFSQSIDHAKIVAKNFNLPYFSTLHSIPTTANLYLLCVNDDAIAKVASQLPVNEGLIVHFSGLKPMSELGNHTNKAVFWPIESVNKTSFIDFKNTPLCIEANSEENFRVIELFANQLSNHVQPISSAQRQYLHLAATITNNFSNHLIALAKNELDLQQLDYTILKHLLTNSINNSFKFEPKNIQTGAAIRNDETTMQTHLQLITNNKLKELYQLMSKSIFDFNQQNHA